MENRQIAVYKTNVRAGQLLEMEKPMTFRTGKETHEEAVINLYDDVQYQEILGFGGAFTESAAYNYHLMGEKNRKKFIEAYFDPKKGIGYSFGRTHIGSCDFSLDTYQYVSDGDKSLASFTIDRDREYIIPLVKEALKATGERLVLFASPWSPPAFMKTTGSALFGGKLSGEYMDTWAQCFVRYIQEFEKEGVAIWGVTVQNEPNAIQTWESCQYSAQEEADFIKNHLAPALDKAGLSDVKIIIWDHNKEQLYDRAKVTLADEDVRRRVTGIGMHWYSGEHFEAVGITKQAFPEKQLLVTEFCHGLYAKERAVTMAERYAYDMIGNLMNGVSGSCDWNLVLDMAGGPYHARFGGCSAPVMYNVAEDELILTPVYYYVGHFSKFIQRGARRIGASKYSERIQVCAFENPDGTIAAVVLNRSPRRVPFHLKYNGLCARGASTPHSIMTLLFNKEQK